MKISEIKDVIREAEPTLDENGDDFRCAVCLLASAHLGPDENLIAKKTGYPIQTVNKFAENFFDSGIWIDGQVSGLEWSGKHGDTAFWCDVMCGLGFLTRAPAGKYLNKEPGSKRAKMLGEADG